MIKNWARSTQHNATEFGVQKLRVLQGRIPNYLDGVLYRNGPALFSRSFDRIKHWFDGDGGILGVHFRNGDVFAHYKYIRTKYFLEEQRRDKFIYGTYGSPTKAGFFSKFDLNMMKNPSNTSVLPLENELLTLYEGGWPHSVDLQTLETKKMDDLGFLRKEETFSAHPKICPKTGEIYNFGITYGSDSYVKTYKMDKKCNIKAVGSAKLENMSPIHDFALTENYVIVMNYSVEFSNFKFITGLKSIGDCFKYNPNIPVTIYIFNRSDMSEACPPIKTDPFLVYHITNGFEKNGEIEIEFAKYKDLDLINEINLGINGKEITPAPNTNVAELTRLTINMKDRTTKFRTILKNSGTEFMSCSNYLTTKEWRYSMFVLYSPKLKEIMNTDLHTAIGRYDHKKDKLEVFDYGDKRFPSEPILVSSNSDPENGHVITVVYDSEAHQSEVWVHHTKSFEGEPVCRLRLPNVVPPGFHGKWSPDSRLLYGEIVTAAMSL